MILRLSNFRGNAIANAGKFELFKSIFIYLLLFLLLHRVTGEVNACSKCTSGWEIYPKCIKFQYCNRIVSIEKYPINAWLDLHDKFAFFKHCHAREDSRNNDQFRRHV
ncbi:hypothetical protein T07_168 [Trichinella nelsoni]|uniref:Uncharacterized protein n=1 Tax=Trichinella nelsoni TaxID=6336 RepID=A0A0V0SC91_9BILA|nr:hypothetical protein T07_168 [Trichinella nelsoni]